ncbi:MAG: hypothetical protein RLZZ172_2410 [Bacteroidota bacterium]|jgi:hypothetical protein
MFENYTCLKSKNDVIMIILNTVHLKLNCHYYQASP